MFYLDTNTCIYFLNGTCASIKKKIMETPPSEIAIPSVVKAECQGRYKFSGFSRFQVSGF